MSVRMMSLVFGADIPDLEYQKDGEKRKAKASTVNVLLLSYADHANDEGEGGYPGYTTLERKTKLSRQGIADTLEACKQNGYLTFEKVSKLGTFSYCINKDLLESLNTPIHEKTTESSHLTPTSQATGLEGVKSLDSNHPLTIPKPFTRAQNPLPARPLDLLDGILKSQADFEQAKKSGKTANILGDAGSFPPDVADRALAFALLYFEKEIRSGAEVELPKSAKSLWTKKIREEWGRKVTPDEIRAAYKHAMSEGMSIKSPGSITYAFKAVKDLKEKNEPRVRTGVPAPVIGARQ